MTSIDLPTRRSAAPAQPPHRAALDLAQLSALTFSLARRPELWSPLVRFDRGERWWTRLDGPDGVDVWLLSWLRSQGTELHDHGAAGAAFTVVRGTLTESRPDSGGGLVARAFIAGQTQTVEPGEVHDVVNEHPEPAVSIHAYSPRLERMTYYAWSAGHVLPTHTVQTHEPESNP